jgi:hypothetical protein
MPQAPEPVLAGSPHAFGLNVDSDGQVWVALLLLQGAAGLGNDRQVLVVVDGSGGGVGRHGDDGIVVVGRLDSGDDSQGGLAR